MSSSSRPPPFVHEQIQGVAQLLHPALPLSLGLIVAEYWLNPLLPALFKRLSQEARVHSLPCMVALLSGGGDAVPDDLSHVFDWLLEAFPPVPTYDCVEAGEDAPSDEVRSHFEDCLSLLVLRKECDARRLCDMKENSLNELLKACYRLTAASPGIDSTCFHRLFVPMVKNMLQRIEMLEYFPAICCLVDLCLRPKALKFLTKHARFGGVMGRKAMEWRLQPRSPASLKLLCDALESKLVAKYM